MREDNITHLCARECELTFFTAQKRIDRAEDPWRAVARAADHYAVGTGEIKYFARLLRRVDITVGEHWNPYSGLDIANGLVLGRAIIKIRSRAPMHGKCLNSTTLGDTRDSHTITVRVIPTCADLERYGHAHCVHNGLENSRHQRLILQQGGAAEFAANFFCGTAHVQIDDLRALIDIETGRFGQRRGIGTRELYHPWLRLSLMAHAQPGLGRVPQADIGCQHLGRGQSRPQLAAQNPERPICHAGHRREHETARDLDAAQAPGFRQVDAHRVDRSGGLAADSKLWLLFAPVSPPTAARSIGSSEGDRVVQRDQEAS
jgi:hypothetical protein